MDEKFCDYFDRWVKEFKEGNIREVTLDKYYCTSKALRKIAPALMMSELDRTAYQRYLTFMAKHTRKPRLLISTITLKLAYLTRETTEI